MFLKLIVLLSFSLSSQATSLFNNSLIHEFKKAMGRSAHKETQNESKGTLEIVNPPEGNHEIKDFGEAKRILKKTHYLGQTKTLYCGCQMTAWNKFTDENCSYKNVGYQKQWQSIEAEHLIPFAQILSNTKAYKEGLPEVCHGDKGRKCAEKVYGFISGDLWIVANPSEMELNRVHSDYQWAELGSKGDQFGSCEFYYQDKKVQPPKHLKGKIARAYKYIQTVYKVKVISDKNEKLFDIWAKYPPTKDQCDLAKEIVKVQKNNNDFEINACKQANLW